MALTVLMACQNCWPVSGPFWPEPGVAHHLGSGQNPAVVLFMVKPGAPLPGVVAEDRAHALARWGEGGLLRDVLPET